MLFILEKKKMKNRRSVGGSAPNPPAAGGSAPRPPSCYSHHTLQLFSKKAFVALTSLL